MNCLIQAFFHAFVPPEAARREGNHWPASWTAGIPLGWGCLLWRWAGWRSLSRATVSWTRHPTASVCWETSTKFVGLTVRFVWLSSTAPEPGYGPAVETTLCFSGLFEWGTQLTKPFDWLKYNPVFLLVSGALAQSGTILKMFHHKHVLWSWWT